MPEPPDPHRSDAAAVYRSLRDAGPAGISALADRLFPVSPDSGPASTVAALRKRSVRRVLDAVSYIRARGTSVWCVPVGMDGAEFTLVRPEFVVSPIRDSSPSERSLVQRA